MGKQDYAYKLYGSFERVYDLACEHPEAITSPGLIVNLHMGVKDLLVREIDVLEFFRERINILRACVIIGDEISGGVVPVDKFEREWRDVTGKLYQYLAEEAEIVDRVFAGLPLRLKKCYDFVTRGESKKRESNFQSLRMKSDEHEERLKFL